MEVVNMARRRPARKKPSRARYEEAHPTISFRLPIETRRRLTEAMRALGLSAAAWIKSHLDQDDRRVEARAQLLAERRGNLRRELERLEHLIERRNQELKAPFDEEKAHLQRKLEEWHQDEERRFQRRKAYNETRLENLRWEVRREQERLSEMQGQIRELIERHRALGDEVRKAEAYCEQMMQAAAMLKLLLDKWSWLFCEGCPASPLNRAILDIVRSMSMSPPQGPPLQPTTEPKPEGMPPALEPSHSQGEQGGVIECSEPLQSPEISLGVDKDEKEVEDGSNASA
jgi:hypothetical protein